MSTKLLLALLEFTKPNGISSVSAIRKYNLTTKEFWSGYAQLQAKQKSVYGSK